MENCKKYKSSLSSINRTEKIRNNFATEHRERRKKRRTQEFDKPRNLSPQPHSTQEDTTRSKTLQRRIDRQKNKTANSQKKKPPFVVGIVRHHFYSPFKRTTEKKIDDKQFREKPEIKKKITKATEKRLHAKATKSVQQKTSATSSESIDVKRKKSFASPTHKFKPLITIPEVNNQHDDVSNKTDTSKYIFDRSTAVQEPILRSNSDSIEEITLKISDKNNSCFQTNSQAIDPTKRSTSIDVKIPTTGSSLSAKSSVVDETNCSKNLPSLSESEHFKQLLCEERDKLQKLCEKWTKIQSDNIKEDICCRINQAVGQTTMLIKEKFKQFHDLIEYSKGSGGLPITSSDLHGFWDTVYIEIKDCDSRFAYLEKLRAACWREELALSSAKSAETETDKNKQAASRKRRSPSLPSVCGKKTAARDDDKTCKEIVNTTVCLTPFVTDKRRTASVFGKETFKKCDKEESANETRMYTSTPLVDRTSKSSPLSSPFITMKINQLYNKTIQVYDATNSPCSWNCTVIENTIIDKDNTLKLNVNKIDS